MLSKQAIKLVEENIVEIAGNSKLTDRQKVEAWLDTIGEFDPACRDEVMRECAADKEARIYYVGRAE